VKIAAAIAFYCATVLSVPTTAQKNDIPKNIAESVGGSLSWTEGQFLSVAEAMPAEKYAFVPGSGPGGGPGSKQSGGNFEGVRSFAEQVKHVACAQFGFFNEIEGKTPPEHCEKGGPSNAKSKAELVKYLKDSFNYGNRILATINEKNALERVEGRYAGPNTRLGIAVAAVWHIADHYGQIVEYLRMNGIVPPPTKQYGSAVR
jgi:glycerophosphoryl diester phosphodiesterase